MKTKPNNRYFNRELKRLTQEMRNDLCTEELKQNDPVHYYSLMDKKLPKKYQIKSFPTAPVNAHIPPQSKLTPKELKVEMEIEKKVKEEKNKKY